MEKLIWHTEKRRVKNLRAHQKNPRILLDAKAEILKESFNKFDLVEIPVVDLDNTDRHLAYLLQNYVFLMRMMISAK